MPNTKKQTKTTDDSLLETDTTLESLQTELEKVMKAHGITAGALELLKRKHLNVKTREEKEADRESQRQALSLAEQVG